MAWSPEDLRTVGYFAKTLVRPPAGFGGPLVDFVCSVSDCDCVTRSPDGWIGRWLHNDLWLFDTLATLEQVIPVDRAADYLRYGLRTLPVSFDEDRELPLDVSTVHPEPIPGRFVRLGFDLCSRSLGHGLECSPLSCNGMAAAGQVNRFCLVDTFDQALDLARLFGRQRPAPGPYVLLEVWADRVPGDDSGPRRKE
jgi:hypothetical protein